MGDNKGLIRFDTKRGPLFRNRNFMLNKTLQRLDFSAGCIDVGTMSEVRLKCVRISTSFRCLSDEVEKSSLRIQKRSTRQINEPIIPPPWFMYEWWYLVHLLTSARTWVICASTRLYILASTTFTMWLSYNTSVNYNDNNELFRRNI